MGSQGFWGSQTLGSKLAHYFFPFFPSRRHCLQNPEQFPGSLRGSSTILNYFPNVLGSKKPKPHWTRHFFSSSLLNLCAFPGKCNPYVSDSFILNSSNRIWWSYLKSWMPFEPFSCDFQSLLFSRNRKSDFMKCKWVWTPRGLIWVRILNELN